MFLVPALNVLSHVPTNVTNLSMLGRISINGNLFMAAAYFGIKRLV